MYADFHCHPAAFAYDSHRQLDNDQIPSHPWSIPQSNLQNLTNAKTNYGYSRVDLAKCVRSDTKLLFASLSPLEKGFFLGMVGSRLTKEVALELYTRIEEEGLPTASQWLLKKLRATPGFKNLRLSDFHFLNNRTLLLTSRQVKKMQQGGYDYFDELKNEYQFFLRKSGEFMATEEEISLDEASAKRKWWGEYHLAAKPDDIDICPEEDRIVIVPTLEGIHSLGIGNPEDRNLREGDSPKDISLHTLKSRIRQLKGLEPLEDPTLPMWKHRPFYITFAGHFYNTLCGHAKSFSAYDSLLFNQRHGINAGAVGRCMEIWQEFLGLNDQLEQTHSKRILIDVCNMSAAARFDYYRNIIVPFNEANPGHKIPVIASHAAYGASDFLETMIRNSKLEKEEDDFFVRGFLGWSINLSDEDLLHIFHSEGLLGLSFDQRLLGGYAHEWLHTLSFGSLERRRSLMLMRRTLEEFIRIPFAYKLHNALAMWDRLAIGTDFDGFMQPMQRYATVLKFRTFEEDLVEILSGMKRAQPIWFGSLRPEDLARKICFENAHAFVKKHY